MKLTKLYERILTAVILIPIVIVCIFFLPPMVFLFVSGLVMLYAGWEWTALAEIFDTRKKIIYLIILALAFTTILLIPIYFVIILGILWWICAVVLLSLYPKGSEWWKDGSLVRGMMGVFVLSLCWLGILILQGFSPEVLMFSLILVWLVDTAAFFVGKKFGKTQLMPLVSPGKTVEGFIGGMIAAVLMAILGIWYFDLSKEQMFTFLMICIFGGAILSTLGDLFESMLKRASGVKDSGNILPGHGGLLDRIDSLTAAMPFFALMFPYILSR